MLNNNNPTVFTNPDNISHDDVANIIPDKATNPTPSFNIVSNRLVSLSIGSSLSVFSSSSFTSNSPKAIRVKIPDGSADLQELMKTSKNGRFVENYKI